MPLRKPDRPLRKISPNFCLAELIRPYGAMLLRRRFSPKRLASKLGRAYRDWSRLLDTLPRDLGEILLDELVHR